MEAISVKNINKDPSKYVICEKHFPNEMFVTNMKKRLCSWAVPSIQLTSKPKTSTLQIASIVSITPVDVDESNDIKIEIYEREPAQDMLEIRYSCDICQSGFETREARNAHIEGHFKTYTCCDCGGAFVGERQFEHHRANNQCVRSKTYIGITFECFVCHKRHLLNPRSLKIHMNRAHGNKSNNVRKEKCEQCNKTFANIYIFRNHIREVHCENIVFTCDICGRHFNRSANLDLHRLVHENRLPCKCNFCGKSFRSTSAVKLHSRTHTGEKPHKCDICNEKAYAYNSDLKRHKRSAHGIIDKVFECDSCDKVFYEPKLLRKHKERVHTNK